MQGRRIELPAKFIIRGRKKNKGKVRDVLRRRPVHVFLRENVVAPTFFEIMRFIEFIRLLKIRECKMYVISLLKYLSRVIKDPCGKRTQHFWPTTRNIVGPNMLRLFAWNHNNVGTCCV